MKLARHRFPSGTKPVVRVGEEWLATAAIDPELATMARVLARRRALAESLESLDPATVPAADGVAVAAADLDAPLERTGTIWAIGLNYRDHAAESDLPLPTAPLLFGKAIGSLTGPFDPVTLPTRLGREFDYEVELAAIIGDEVKAVDAAAAAAAIAGYAVANDLSCRDVQFGDGQWIRSKSFDGFCPIGPWITVDEVDPGGLRIRCWVGDDLRQDSSTSQLVFTVPEIVAHLAAATTLRPGDVVLTGTPAGVAMGRPDRPWLRPGDVVRCEIDGLGSLRTELR